jgi:hypothetical protein
MSFRLSNLRACRALVAGLVFAFALAGVHAKPLRLRNAIIPGKAPAKPAARVAQSPARARASGLYLIQFRETPKPEWRDQLRDSGIELLRYVPEDAFVARFRNVSIDAVQALPFVDQVAEYRPEYKIHASLRSSAGAKAAAGLSQVNVLLAPRSTPAAIAGARNTFAAAPHQLSLRSGTLLRGPVSVAQLDALARSDTVLWIEPARPMKLFDEVSSAIVAGEGGPNQLYTQSLGYDGSGVAVAVADSGLNNGDAGSMHPDLYGRTPAFFYYGTLPDAADEHSHGTHVSGIIAGNGAAGELDENNRLYGLGVAPGAGIIAQRIFDGVGSFQPPIGGFEQLTRDATTAGAVIGSNSWGDDTQGRYDASAMVFDELVRDANALRLGDQAYILEFSAGNAGPGQQTIGSPAVAKNVIATGASQNDRPDFYIYDGGPDAMADFSSRGPCEDGRIKPDLVAPGTWIASLQSASASDENAWAPISANYQYQGGTSQAGPHVSGAAAVFVQYYRQTHTNATPSPALVKAALINAAADMDDAVETGPVPNMDEGWGRLDLTPLFDPERAFDFTDQSELLTNGQVFERHVILAGPAQPLKVTLVYTDVAGFPGALAALVNDLDLEVLAPDGRLYRGNQFAQGESIPGAAGPDTINNVEAVHLREPLPGEYVVRVRARNVVEDARFDTPAVDQDYALVISGEVPAPGTGLLMLDRAAYRAPSRIQIKLIDRDLASQSTATALARSTTEPAGEPVLLQASGSSGTFTGALATATGVAAPDGVLQIAHNDSIEARYFDASAGVYRTATARGDLVPPVLTSVVVSNEFGQTLVSWQTDEPADSVVRYSRNLGLGRAATNEARVTGHTVSLPELAPGQTYYFHVASTDEAGNTATNNNGGALFSFVAQPAHTLLLVDEFVSNGFDEDIPLSVYTNALSGTGVSYDVWDSAALGRSPGTNDLKPYRVVMWRFNDGVFSLDTLAAADQNSIRDYLNQGGSFFMASMEQLTRLGNGFFRRDVLHVADFAEDAGVPDIEGVTGDSITAGMSMTLGYTQYSNFWHEALEVPDDISDTLTLSPEAAPILKSFGEVAGMKFPRTGRDSPGRVVFLSFPLDAVPEAGPAPDNRAALLGNIIAFLVPGVKGRGTIALDAAAYRIPAVATVEVGDSDLAGQGTALVNFSSSTQTNGVGMALDETSRAGLFRGSIELIAATNPPVAGKVRVAHGDLVWVDYYDASSNLTVRATATVDTIQPGISGVLAEPDYENAVVTWTTTEPASSLIQFGESTFLNRTASDPALVTLHELDVRGLLPDKTYYFQVVSLDEAGNAMVDDNGGRLYSMHTLQPLGLPWSDRLNTGATNWSVFSADEAQCVWTLGKPENQLGTNNAPSPPDAWASNLHGDPVDYSESFLISPAIYLSGGNVASLRFWNNYDFTERSEYDIVEGGQLLIVTNAASEPVVLATFSDFSAGWEEEEIDLTPFIGHVVYLVWYYQLFSLDTLPRPGWLVDDVSVTISNIVPGTIQITKSLWQAPFILAGPIYRTGREITTLITNAPPGQYLVNFGDAPYYQTPPPQTNLLVSGATVLFQGDYTFVDTNTNGIPDAWELEAFGTVNPARTRWTDTDGDGMSDWQEFVAGTDPNNPLPPFHLTALPVSNGTFRLEWPSASGMSYRLVGSTNAITWVPYSDWIRASGPATDYAVGMETSGPVRLFRIEALGTGTPGGLAPNLRLTARLTNNLVRLEWPAGAGRAYRVWDSANGRDWMPVSVWIQAVTTRTLGLTLPDPVNGTLRLFRVEVQP